MQLKRIIHGVGANLFGQLVTTAIQLGSVPVLLGAWGAESYGTWVLLLAIPSYLGVSDFGFLYAAGNEMAFAASKNDFATATRIFQSMWNAIAAVAGGLFILAVLAVYVSPDHWFETKSNMSNGELRLTLVLLSASTLISLYIGLAGATFRAAGKYATGVYIYEGARLVEAGAVLVVAISGGGLAAAAFGSLITKALGTIVSVLALVKMIPWVHFAWSARCLVQAKTLFKPAIAVFAMAVGYAMLVQGTTIIVSVVAGVSGVAIFNTTRTMARTTTQLAALGFHAVAPEVSLAIGAGDGVQLRKLIAGNTILVAGLSVGMSLVLVIWGPQLIEIWTRGRLPVDRTLLDLLLASSLLAAIWSGNANILLAAGRAREFSFFFVAACAASIILAAVLGAAFSVIGVAAAMLICDATMTWFVSRKAYSLFSSYSS